MVELDATVVKDTLEVTRASTLFCLFVSAKSSVLLLADPFQSNLVGFSVIIVEVCQGLLE